MRPADSEALSARLRGEARRCDAQGRPVPGRFLTGGEPDLARHEAREAGVCVSFDGGYPQAERVQVCFHPPGEEPVFTGVWVRAAWDPRFAALTHRDLLGSLLALFADRSRFGDLICEEGCAWLYALPELARMLPGEWTQAGRTALHVSLPDEPPVLHLPEGRRESGTVASLRLDSLLSDGMRLSRAKAAEIIRQGLVSVCHEPEARVDRVLAPGDLVSVRGFGRIRLAEAGEPTRKGRIPVILEIFSDR